MSELDPFKQEELKKALAKAARVRAERIAARRKSDLQKVLKTPEGRRVFWSHLEAAGYFTLSFEKGAPDVTAKNEGMREVGKTIFERLMEADPEAFFQMYRENASEVAQFKSEDERLIQEAHQNG